MTPGQKLLSKAVQAHGGKKYDKAHYSFVFRKKNYVFKNDGQKYHYQLTSQRNNTTRVDVLSNDGFSRTENGKVLDISAKDQARFGNGLNSVIYFATLPHKLQDKAVNKKHVGTKKIKGINYEVLEVSFNEDGGGVDHEDIYYYWINAETHLIDFLAYNYKVNGGGVRFRSAYNTRRVDGIVFQDYINYKANVGTPLADLPGLWEAERLKELSRIVTEDVKSL
jgi:hypothetical protein